MKRNLIIILALVGLVAALPVGASAKGMTFHRTVCKLKPGGHCEKAALAHAKLRGKQLRGAHFKKVCHRHRCRQSVAGSQGR